MSSEQSRFLGVTEEIGARGEIEVFHLDTKEVLNGALVHTIDDVDEVWTRERRPLGVGGFGVAWLEKSTIGKARVVKEVKKIVNTNVMTEYWLRELSAMALLHRNTKYFPRFYGWFHDKDYVYIAMEHVNQGDLRECVTCPLPEPQSQSIVKQVAQALRILHKKGITHRDLKPANILVRQGPTPSWRVVVTDFGISKRVRDLTTSLYSSFGGDTTFMAPEILGWANDASNDYTNAVDMWSLGCLAYWLLKMKLPVPVSSMVPYCRSSWAKGAASVDTTGIDEPGKDFILSLISPDPNCRMNAEDACGHVWLTSMSLNSTAASPRLLDHDVATLREEQALIRTRPRNFEGLSNRHDSRVSVTAQGTATLPTGRSSDSSKIARKAPFTTPKLRHALPNPQTPEIRDESTNRQGREGWPRQGSSTLKYQVRKDEDAFGARKVPTSGFWGSETSGSAQKQAPQKLDTPQARIKIQPEAGATRRSSPQQPSPKLDQQSVREAYTESWLNSNGFYTSSEGETPSEHDSENEVRYKWHVPNVQEHISRRNRGSDSDGNKQHSANSQRPLRRSLPNEAEPQPASPPPNSAPTFVVTTDGEVHWYRDYFPPPPRPRQDGSFSNTGLTDNTMLFLPSWGGVKLPHKKQTDSTRAHYGFRSDSGSQTPEVTSEFLPDRGRESRESSVTFDSRGIERHKLVSRKKEKPGGAWGREEEKPPTPVQILSGLTGLASDLVQKPKAKAKEQKEEEEREDARSVENTRARKDKERIARGMRNTYTRPPPAYVEDYPDSG